MALIFWFGVIAFLVVLFGMAIIRALFQSPDTREPPAPTPNLSLLGAGGRPLDLAELQALFIAAWGAPKPDYQRTLDRSFTWVVARDQGKIVGFVNVAWDGGAHFFLLDTTVHPDYSGQGIGRDLVSRAIEACRGHGDWLHVDAPVELMERLYSDFQPTSAGLVDLRMPAAVGSGASTGPGTS